MIIDLRSYGGEVAAYVAAAKSFVDRTAWTRLQAMQSDLEYGRDNQDDFVWRTSGDIRTRIADRYDGSGKVKPPIVLTLGFHARFKRLAAKRTDFQVVTMVTHLLVFPEDNLHQPALHIHVDKKNAGQLGPEMHVQVSEAFTKQASGMPLAIPRLPSGFLLPTDCLDIMLTEIFPDEWPEAQASAHEIQSLRQAQLQRLRRLGAQLEEVWKGKQARTPFSALQNCDLAALRLA